MNQKLYINNPDTSSLRNFIDDFLFKKDTFLNEECTEIQCKAKKKYNGFEGEELQPIRRSITDIKQVCQTYFPDVTYDQIFPILKYLGYRTIFCPDIVKIVICDQPRFAPHCAKNNKAETDGVNFGILSDYLNEGLL